MNAPIIEADRIRQLLPYGPDFLFLDRVWSIEPGKSITTSMDYDGQSAILSSHFLDGPAIVPGVIMAEQACQSALLLALISRIIPAGHRFLIGRMQCTFEKPAFAACRLKSVIELELSLNEAVAFRAGLWLHEDSVAKIKAVARSVPAIDQDNRP